VKRKYENRRRVPIQDFAYTPPTRVAEEARDEVVTGGRRRSRRLLKLPPEFVPGGPRRSRRLLKLPPLIVVVTKKTTLCVSDNTSASTSISEEESALFPWILTRTAMIRPIRTARVFLRKRFNRIDLHEFLSVYIYCL